MATAKCKSPSSKQYEQWKFSLKNTLEDADGIECFYQFLIKHEQENLQKKGQYTRYLDFWKECHRFKDNPTKSLEEHKKLANDIFKQYLDSRAKNKIKLAGDDDIVSNVRKELENLNSPKKGPDVILCIFDEALDGMRQYLDEGGCCGAYEKWKSQLKVVKKSKGFSCRLM